MFDPDLFFRETNDPDIVSVGELDGNFQYFWQHMDMLVAVYVRYGDAMRNQLFKLVTKFLPHVLHRDAAPEVIGEKMICTLPKFSVFIDQRRNLALFQYGFFTGQC